MGYNISKPGSLKCQVTIAFYQLTDEQREYLYEAEACLRKAGISFDTGGSCNVRDWEFDYSLSPNVTVWLKQESPQN